MWHFVKYTQVYAKSKKYISSFFLIGFFERKAIIQVEAQIDLNIPKNFAIQS